MKLFSLIFSLIAVAISVMCLPSFGFMVNEGNIIALIGVCTALIVGLNIYDAITVRKIDKKAERLQQKINNLEKLEYRSEINFKISCGLYARRKQTYTSFLFIFKALSIAMIHDDAECVEKCLSLLSQFDKINSTKTKNQSSSDSKLKDSEIEQILEKIEKCRLYNLYNKRIQKVLKSVGIKN